jgi:DNA-binding response OmpR family regulator
MARFLRSNWFMEPGGMVLVATASENFRRLICRELGRNGFAYESVGTAGEALRAAVRGSYAAVVTDAHLPGCAGASLIHDLRARGIATPAVLLADGNTSCLREPLLELGATHRLTGPDLSRLTLAIAQARRPALRSSRPS